MRSQLTKQTRTLLYSKKDCFKRTVARVFPHTRGGRYWPRIACAAAVAATLGATDQTERSHGVAICVSWVAGLFYVSHSRGRAQEKAFGERTEGLARLIPRGNHFFISSFFVLFFISPFPILTDTT